MIILIDDKIKRQDSYGWTSQRFEMLKDVFYCLTDYSFLDDDTAISNVFSFGNVVLFHESFFNDIDITKKKDAERFCSMMEEYADKEKLLIVYFSGTKTARIKDGNKAYMPVSVLYENLEYYVNNYSKENSFEYLLWGKEPNIERELSKRIEEANNAMTMDNCGRPDVPSSVFIARTQKNRLNLPGMNPNDVDSIIYINFKSTDPVSDELLHNYIQKRLAGKEYNAIFLPLCFGPTLSDYNGLRLAMHIRCTKTPNQLKPIYIYGVVDMLYLVDNEYFDIFKTKGVSLINYSTNSIYFALENNHSALCLNQDLLSGEVKKIRLNLPKNYIDSHSIANEWAIYRWAKTIGTSDADINEVVKNVETNLYFKYLNTIYPISSSNQLNKNNLIISTNCKNKPKVLLVDDEAKKGWFKIFCSILKDANGFYFDHLDDEFNGKSSDEIVQIVHEKVVSEDIDIVVLDYRLHRSDYFAEHIKDVTGYKVLYDIKNHINPGIQVIVLSATNKIWNLRALQKAGANEFILKESPSESINEQSAAEEIDRMVKSFANCCEKVFLKKFYEDYFLVNSFLQQEIRNKSVSSEMFVEQVLKWLKLSCDVLKNEVNDQTIASSYLFMFSVLENAANVIIDTDPKLCEDENKKGRFVYRYLFKDAGNSDYLMRFNGETCQKTKYILEYEYDNLKTIPWIQKLLNAIDRVGANNIDINYKHLIDVRNDFIHANSSDAVKALLGEEVGIKLSELIELQKLVCHFLNNIK